MWTELKRYLWGWGSIWPAVLCASGFGLCLSTVALASEAAKNDPSAMLAMAALGVFLFAPCCVRTGFHLRTQRTSPVLWFLNGFVVLVIVAVVVEGVDPRLKGYVLGFDAVIAGHTIRYCLMDLIDERRNDRMRLRVAMQYNRCPSETLLEHHQWSLWPTVREALEYGEIDHVRVPRSWRRALMIYVSFPWFIARRILARMAG